MSASSADRLRAIIGDTTGPAETRSNNILLSVMSRIPERSFHNHTHILYDIRTLLGDLGRPAVYCEIGSYCGASAALMLQHPLDTKVICIDPLNLPAAHYGGTAAQDTTLLNNVNRLNVNNRVIDIVKAFSGDAVAIWKAAAGVDIMFIDGDHSHGGVLADFNNYAPHVVKGGFIVFDDYLDAQWSPEVRPAVDQIAAALLRQSPPTFEVIGSLENVQRANAYPLNGSVNLNEFILRKL